MHAYLLVGQGINNYQLAINNLVKKLHSKVLEYPLQKIEDVRSLNNLIRLSFNEPTLIVSQNINDATDEALNAFLKNLEEPQDNVYFALTSPSVRKVLPTVVSRCEVIKIPITNFQFSKNDEIFNFLNMSTGEKLNYIDKIKDRNKAIELAENTVNLLHGQLHSGAVKYKVIADNIELASVALTRLKANGNVNLQLTNMVINFEI